MARKRSYIPRLLTSTLEELASQYLFLALIGSRKSGKTTLIRNVFPDYDYVTLRNDKALLQAASSPDVFLRSHSNPTIIDDVDLLPELLEILPVISQFNIPNYIFSSSCDIQLSDNTTSALTDMMASALLPTLSLAELDEADRAPDTAFKWIALGGYPSMYVPDKSRQAAPLRLYTAVSLPIDHPTAATDTADGTHNTTVCDTDSPRAIVASNDTHSDIAAANPAGSPSSDDTSAGLSSSVAAANPAAAAATSSPTHNPSNTATPLTTPPPPDAAAAATPSFLATYLRTLILPGLKSSGEIGKLNDFMRFTGACAQSIGQPLNMDRLAKSARINIRTANRWLEILQSRFLIQLLPAYQEGTDRYQTKSPKLYFCDTGLGFETISQYAGNIALDDYIQVLFENAVVSEIAKSFYAEGRAPSIYYWRDSMGREISLLVEMSPDVTLAIRIVGTTSVSKKSFKMLDKLAPMFGIPPEHRLVVYMGNRTFDTPNGRVVSYRDIS